MYSKCKVLYKNGICINHKIQSSVQLKYVTFCLVSRLYQAKGEHNKCENATIGLTLLGIDRGC